MWQKRQIRHAAIISALRWQRATQYRCVLRVSHSEGAGGGGGGGDVLFCIDVDRTSQKRVQMKTLYIALRLKLGFDPVTHDVSAVTPLCVCGGWGWGWGYFFKLYFNNFKRG